MDIDVDNLLAQIDGGKLEVGDPYAYWLAEGWRIALGRIREKKLRMMCPN